MMFVSRKNILFFIFILICIHLSGCSSSTETNDKEVRLAWAGTPRVWVLGKLNGDYEKAFGRKVKWVEYATGADVLNYFAANEIDIARFGSNPAVAGISRGLPIEVIGIEGLISSSERLIGAKSIHSIQDLIGKRVAYPPNSTSQYALEQAFVLNKIDKRKIKLIPLKPNEIISAWKRGDIDAAYLWEPFAQQLESEQGHTLYRTKELNDKGILIYNNFAVRKEFAEKNPDLVIKFLQAYQKNVDEYNKNPDEVASKISVYLNVPKNQVLNSLNGIQYISLHDQTTEKYLGNGQNSITGIDQSMKNTADFLVKTGEINQSDVKPDYAPFINTHYLLEAIKGDK